MNETITIKKEDLWKYSTFILAAIIIVGGIILSVSNNESNSDSGNIADNPGQFVPPPSAKAEVSEDDDAILGNKNAPVTVIEFSDYQCPFCRKFWQDTLPEIKKNYIDTGKVKFVYRDFPLGFHEGAIPYANAAECAREKGGDKAYFKMHDKIFEEQNILDGGTVSSTVQYPGAETLKKWAKDIGYDIGNCIDNVKYKNEIQKDLTDGSNSGVTGTPGFFINGKLLSGAQPFSAFKQVIDAELN